MIIRFTAVAAGFSILGATSAFADCKTDIQTIMQSMEASPPYRVEMSVVSGDTTMKMQGEAIMPHSIHMKSDVMEMVMTPNGVWMGQGGKLQKSPAQMQEQVQSMIKQAMSMGVASVEAAECLGSTDFEDGTYDHYKYVSNTALMGIATTAKVDVYLNNDRRPVWMVIDGEAMGTKSVTTQHIVYDDSITIADPE
jgi:hypothetical protein